MAEFLILANDLRRTRTGELIYSADDVIDCHEDGHKWGKAEGPPVFYVVKMEGLKLVDAQKYLEPAIRENIDIGTGETEIVTVKQRKWKFAYDAGLSEADRETVARDGVLSKSAGLVSLLMIDKTKTAEKL